MPIYEYRCESCGHEFEKMQKLADPPLTDCPVCGRPDLRKVISPVGFRLKGSGWYETDFKKGDKKKNLHDPADKAAGGKDGGDKKETPAAEAKSETKAKAKPEPKASSAGG